MGDQDQELPGSAFPVATGGGSPVLGPRLVIPLPGSAALTQADNDAELVKVRTGYSNKVGIKLSAADGGTVGIFADLHRDRLAATGYSNWSRGKGAAVGAELTFDLSK